MNFDHKSINFEINTFKIKIENEEKKPKLLHARIGFAQIDGLIMSRLIQNQLLYKSTKNSYYLAKNVIYI